jgi:hypothetical protein
MLSVVGTARLNSPSRCIRRRWCSAAITGSAWTHFGGFQRFPMPRANNAVTYVEMDHGGKVTIRRVDIDKLFVSERHNRIDAHGAAGRRIGGKQCDGQKQEGDFDEGGDPIDCIEPIEQTAQDVRRSHR